MLHRGSLAIALFLAMSCGGRLLDEGAQEIGGAAGSPTVGGTGAGRAGSGGSAGDATSTNPLFHIPPPPSEFQTCSGSGECELMAINQCACGGTVGVADVYALNRKFGAEHLRGSVPSGTPNCPDCLQYTPIDPHFAARCESGQCKAFDVRARPDIAGCHLDSECVLRPSLSCCFCDQSSTPTQFWVAVKATTAAAQALENEVCAGTAASSCSCSSFKPPLDRLAKCIDGTCENTSRL